MNTRLCIDGEGAVVTLPEDIGVTVKEGDEELGVIYPVVGGVRIVSPHIENRMALTYMEVTDPPALRINLHKPTLPVEGGWEAIVDRPNKMEVAVDLAVRHVYASIFQDGMFTHAEEMFAWGQVLEKLLNTLNLDLQREMLSQRFAQQSKRR